MAPTFSPRSTSQVGHHINPLATPIRDEHDNGFLARTYPLFLFFTVFVLLLATVV